MAASAEIVLLKLSLNELKTVAAACGIAGTGPKQRIASRLWELGQGPTPARLFSIDLGTKNLACCRISSKFEIEHLQLHDLGFPEAFDPRAYAGIVGEFAKTHLIKEACPILVERQRYRTGGGRAIPEAILKVNLVEAMLHCFLINQSTISVTPQRVALYFGHPEGKAKKQASVKLVTEMLADGRVKWGDKVDRSIWEAAGKKDDLADCILQGVAYFRWKAAAASFLTEQHKICC